MRKQVFYLDTNVISELANPKLTDRNVCRRLIGLVRYREIQFIGSVVILEELAGLACIDAEQFTRSLDLFWKLAGNNVLVGRGDLLVNEISKGSMLSRAEAMLDTGVIRRLQMLRNDNIVFWDEIAKHVIKQGKIFQNEMHHAAKKLDDKMLESIKPRDICKNASQVDSEIIVKDVFNDLLKSNRAKISGSVLFLVEI